MKKYLRLGCAEPVSTGVTIVPVYNYSRVQVSGSKHDKTN